MGLSALIVAVLLTSAPTPKEPPAVEAANKRVKELQKERIAALKKAADAGFDLAKNARLDMVAALEDRLELLRAELDAAEKESERVALYVKTLDALKAYEEVADAQFRAGRGTERVVLKIKARRLETEIALERAKIREAREK